MNTIDVELDNPVWHALSGPHANLGANTPLAALYHPAIARFGGLQEPSGEAFTQLAGLTGSEEIIALATAWPVSPSRHWHVVNVETLEQFVCERLAVLPFAGGEVTAPLVAADVEQMLALAAETQPGPFSAETIRCGHYAGVWDNAALVAMAGERMRLNHAVEISGVCTAASHRGKGLAGLLVQTLAARALSQELLPFLHVRTANTSAIRLYELLGFRHRQTMQLTILKKAEAA
jgi:ribosomal protein S18 acetylase RimI-like enzyme